MADIVNWGVLSTALIATGKVIPGMQRCLGRSRRFTVGRSFTTASGRVSCDASSSSMTRT